MLWTVDTHHCLGFQKGEKILPHQPARQTPQPPPAMLCQSQCSYQRESGSWLVL